MHRYAITWWVVIPILLAGCSGADQTHGNPSPATMPPEETAVPVAPAASMSNGRIQSIDEYLSRVRPACDDCYPTRTAFDQDSGTLLVTYRRHGSGRAVGLSVVGADGLLADLACPDELSCRVAGHRAATLGPGADELTLPPARGEVKVIGYDGTVRRTIDLSTSLDGSSRLGELAWSPDGGRLAVETEDHSSGLTSHLWLVDRDGRDPLRVHTAAYTGPLSGVPLGYIGGLTWSPDGRSLGFVEEQALLRNLSEQSRSIRAVSLLLPGPGQKGPGTPRTLYPLPPGPFDRTDFLWSPDGTRVAVRVHHQVLELSADDGSVLARHPFECSTTRITSCLSLTWPARRS